ncbi:unnamed protein product [Porites evermanni]|uniref:Homeobox domain-containing protein n=1 Tax=Porites evermanni TaxID=104178 RepID=A0ABN8QY38_9CNID|nr:unnamed protein product [Porites evermanni]
MDVEKSANFISLSNDGKISSNVALEEGESTSVKCFDPDTSTERFSWHDDYRKRILEEIFVLSPYLNSCEHKELASNLGMEKKTLQKWFKNKRYRLRKKQATQACCPHVNDPVQSSSAAASSSSLFHQEEYLSCHTSSE